MKLQTEEQTANVGLPHHELQHNPLCDDRRRAVCTAEREFLQPIFGTVAAPKSCFPNSHSLQFWFRSTLQGSMLPMVLVWTNPV